MHENNLQVPQPPVWASPSDLGSCRHGVPFATTLRAFAGASGVTFELAWGEGVAVDSSGLVSIQPTTFGNTEVVHFAVRATAVDHGMQSIRLFKVSIDSASEGVAQEPWEPVPPPPEPEPQPAPKPEPPQEPPTISKEEIQTLPVLLDEVNPSIEAVSDMIPEPEPVSAPEPVVAPAAVEPEPEAVAPTPPPSPLGKEEIWTTPAGSIGIYASGERFSHTFEAKGARMYHLIRGRLPQGTMLTKSTGRLSGTLRAQSTTTTFQFTLRADTGQGFSDRTFKLTVKAAW